MCDCLTFKQSFNMDNLYMNSLLQSYNMGHKRRFFVVRMLSMNDLQIRMNYFLNEISFLRQFTFSFFNSNSQHHWDYLENEHLNQSFLQRNLLISDLNELIAMVLENFFAKSYFLHMNMNVFPMSSNLNQERKQGIYSS